MRVRPAVAKAPNANRLALDDHHSLTFDVFNRLEWPRDSLSWLKTRPFPRHLANRVDRGNCDWLQQAARFTSLFSVLLTMGLRVCLNAVEILTRRRVHRFRVAESML
jgi:hypothetical protein